MKTPTEQERSELQKLFEKTTETPVINGNGEFDIDYVTWLEDYVYDGQSPIVAHAGEMAEEIADKLPLGCVIYKKEILAAMHEYAAAVHPMPTDEEINPEKWLEKHNAPLLRVIKEKNLLWDILSMMQQHASSCRPMSNSEIDSLTKIHNMLIAKQYKNARIALGSFLSTKSK